MIIIENKNIKSEYLEEEQFLITVFKGRVNIDLALGHLRNSVEFYNKVSVKASIADISQVHGSFVKVMGFMQEIYYPAAVKSGLKCAAYVVSKDLINNHLGKKLKDVAASFKIKSATFFDINEAKIWVRLNY